MASVAEKENVQTVNLIKKPAKNLKFGGTKTQSLANFKIRDKTGPFGISATKPIANSGRKVLGDVKNVCVNVNKNGDAKLPPEKFEVKKKIAAFEETTKKRVGLHSSSKPLEPKAETSKAEIIRSAEKENLDLNDSDEIEYFPPDPEKQDSFEDILPLSERVASIHPSRFKNLFISSTPPDLDPSDDPLFREWESSLQPLETVDDLLKQTEQLHSDVNYPMSDEDFALMKEICDCLRH